MIKNILITGGSGFIGSNIACKLIEMGFNVTVLDCLSKQIHGDNPDLSFLFSKIKDKVNFICGDVRNRADWEAALKGQDAVINLAAETGTGQSMYMIEKYTDVNIRGTSLLLDILANNKSIEIKKVVIASSRSIYGEGKYVCVKHGIKYPDSRSDDDLARGRFGLYCEECGSEMSPVATSEDSKIHPASLYAITKQVQEQMTLLTCKTMGVPAVAFRYQNVYGPGQSLSNPYTGILSIFSKNMLNNQDINIFEDGLESRDFVYIDDVVRATITGLLDDNVKNGFFNVGTGYPISVLAVAEKLKAVYGSKSKITISGNYRLGDIRHNFADTELLKKELGFSCNYTFDTGISKFTEWVNLQSVEKDSSYETSLHEMKSKGFFK